MSLTGKLLEAAKKPIESEPAFSVGQTVRVLKNVSDDGQTPKYWSGAKCECIGRGVGGMIMKRWVYQLRHENGRTCEFQEHELDLRFAKAT